MEENVYDFSTKTELINKLIDYSKSPDDDNIRYKEKIKKILLSTPELLYALHDKDLEHELFNDDGTLNTEGEWDNYWGENSLIRPYLFFPQTSTHKKNYICYQTMFNELVRGNNVEKYLDITFTVFVNSGDIIDKYTGIPRHDLIAAILRERFAWASFEISKTKPTFNKESIMDNTYLVRTLQFEIMLPNEMSVTKNGITSYSNRR
jgi:hypothetical protein